MSSIAHTTRRALEAQGEYVVRANINWFAVFPLKLEKLIGAAQRIRGTNPNLVVYRTRSNDERDHHVIPVDLLGDLLKPETLSDSTAGERRWNLTLDDDGQLHVTHRAGAVNVAAYRGLPLLVEQTLVSDLITATADPVELEHRVRQLMRQPVLARPSGDALPARHVATTEGFARRPDVKAWVLRVAAGTCELCRQPAPFVTGEGEPYLEHHHVQQLAHGGPDTVENSVAVCPNCHRQLHHAADRASSRNRLYELVSRLLRPIGGR
jgi:5-methylcytosine-specific restriction endonuclease McrA